MRLNEEGDEVESIPFEMQEEYVHFAKHFSTEGIDTLVQIVKDAVEAKIGSEQVSRQFEIGELVSVLSEIRKTIESKPNRHSEFLKLTLPSEDSESVKSAEGIIKSMLEETYDVLENPDTKVVFSTCLDACLDHLFDQLSRKQRH